MQLGDWNLLVPAHLGSPGKRAVKRVCVRVCLDASSGGWAGVSNYPQYESLCGAAERQVRLAVAHGHVNVAVDRAAGVRHVTLTLRLHTQSINRSMD